MAGRSGLDTWSGVELRHLAALAAIHEEGSFRAAADRLGYVQSAVSQRLSQLEAIVGVRLVNRTRGHTSPVQLTEPGLLLIQHARRILSQLDAAQADLRAFATEEEVAQTPLRVGIDTGVARRLAPTIMLQLAVREPHLRVRFSESGSDRAQLEQIARGELDAAFAELPLGRADMSSTVILTDPCALVVRRSSALGLRPTPPTLAELAEQPLVVLSDWQHMELVESHLRSAGCRLTVEAHAASGMTAQALVAAGVGAALVPRLAVDESDPAVATIDVSHLLPSRRLAFCSHERRRRLQALGSFQSAAIVAARRVARGYEAAPATVSPQVAVA